MAQHDSFARVPIGKQFTVDAWHANADGTALILTKSTDLTATDASGRVWNFTDCQGLQCFER